jgi:hypothetical protein
LNTTQASAWRARRFAIELQNRRHFSKRLRGFVPITFADRETARAQAS